MRRIVLFALVVFCLGGFAYGQGRSNDGWRGPQPSGAYGLVWNNAKRAWEVVESRAVQAYQERRHEQQRHDAALRREWEAHYRAAYAERAYPSSWLARSLRESANQASMERARAEAAVRLRAQNDRQYIYGNRVTTVPTRDQWIRPNSVDNRTRSWPLGRSLSERERSANEYRDRALEQVREKSRQIERAGRSGRPTGELVREHKQALDNYVKGVVEASRARRDATDRNGANDKTPRDSQRSRDSGSGDKQSWQDRQREIFSSRP